MPFSRVIRAAGRPTRTHSSPYYYGAGGSRPGSAPPYYYGGGGYQWPVQKKFWSPVTGRNTGRVPNPRPGERYV